MTESSVAEIRRTFLRRAGYTLRVWRRVVDEQLRPFNLTDASWLPLLMVSRNTEPMRQKDLADAVGIESSTLVRILDQLNEAGLIERCPDTDRRAKIIRLTPAGKALAAEVETVVNTFRAKVLADIDDEELMIAHRVVDRVCLAIEQCRCAQEEAVPQ